MIHTGVSLVVGDGSNMHEPNIYNEPLNERNSSNIRRRQATNNQRMRIRRPGAYAAATATADEGTGQQQYWRGRVEDDNTGAQGVNPSRRRKQPATIREPLAALEKEQKLYELRDKQRQESAPNVSTRDKSYRRPYSQAKKEFGEGANGGGDATAAALPTTSATAAVTTGDGGGGRTTVDLKNILKNAGGLSLSEILQQKNLSLDDLLKGKQNALQVLQGTAAAPQQQAGVSDQTAEPKPPLKPMRRAPYKSSSSAGQQATNKEDDDNAEATAEERVAGGFEESANTTPQMAHGRVKMPNLQRMKNLVSTTRGGVTMQQDFKWSAGSTTRRISMPTSTSGGSSSSTRTSTTTPAPTTTTTRLPLYKKNLMHRSTLKPPFLLKNAMPTATVSAEPEVNEASLEVKEAAPELNEAAPNFEERLTTTIVNNRYNKEPPSAEGAEADADADADAEDEEDMNVEQEEEEAAAAAKTEVKVDEATTAAEGDTEEQQQGEAYLRDEEDENDEEGDEEGEKDAEEMTTKYREEDTTKASTTKRITTQMNNSAPTARTRPALRAQPSLKTNSIEVEDAREDDAESEGEGFVRFFGSLEGGRQTNADKNNNNSRRRGEKTTTASTSTTTTTTPPLPTRLDRIKTASVPAESSHNNNNGFAYSDTLPDFDGVDDRTDLLELIEDRRSGNRLFKVLEQRNMTLEELIEHRKRGSSQLHLATVVQKNRSRFFPGQKVVLHDNMDIVTAFENFPHFNLIDLKSVKPDDIKTDSQGASYFTSIIDIEPTDEVYTNGDGNADDATTANRASSANFLQPPQRTEKSVGFFPSWKTLALASLASSTHSIGAADVSSNKLQSYFVPPAQMLLESNSNSGELDERDLLLENDTNDTAGSNNVELQQQQTSGAVNEVLNDNGLLRGHDLLDLELSGHGFKRSPAAAVSTNAAANKTKSLYGSMSPGIRSAIVASAAIVLTALTTFMVIFGICRWKQRRLQRKTSYTKTYNAMKSKMPTTTGTGTGTGTGTNASSRRSSLRHMEEMIGGGGGGGTHDGHGGGGGGVSTVSVSPMHQLQHQTSLLFPQRHCTTAGKGKRGGGGNSSRNSGRSFIDDGEELSCMRNDGNRRSIGGMRDLTRNCLAGVSGGDGGGGRGSATGSTTSLALSLLSVRDSSTNKLNTMDPNSPEVQEYLFDALRKSY